MNTSALRPLFSVLCLLALATFARAQTSAPQVSEAVAAEFGQLRTLTEAKSYAPALALVERLLGAVGPDSYDRILLGQIKAQILLTQGAYTAAIAPLEEVLRLADLPGYLAPAARTDTLFLLAQLHQQDAAAQKTPAAQRAALDRAAALLAAWESRIQKPTTDGRLFAASLHYQRAILDPAHPDPAALDAALRSAEDGLRLRLDPPSALYVILLAARQQREEHAAAAELLELLVTRQPDNTGYWQQLVSTYLNLAATAAPDERLAARYNTRALLALERAQARGLLATLRDRFNLVALHLALRQTAAAAVLLENGLADGTLENTRRNWELLANTLQQAGRPDSVIAALEKAVAALPGDGQLDYLLAQAAYTAGSPADARRHLEAAFKKKTLPEKPGQALLFLAYVAYEQKDYPAAAAAARDAATRDDVKKEDLARLTQAIADAAKS